jgi:hypothetical protein
MAIITTLIKELKRLRFQAFILEYINTVWILSRRLQTPENLLMIDVDYLKKLERWKFPTLLANIQNMSL